MLKYVFVVVGFFLLLGGAEAMVRGAVGIAEKLRISKMAIGMTVVALGTSAPELLVAINATLSGSSALAIGNLIGSNIANILLILGVSGLIFPIALNPKTLTLDGWVLVGGTALFMVLAMPGKIELFGGLTLLLFFAGFLYYSYRRGTAGHLAESNNPGEGDIADTGKIPKATSMYWIFLFVGFAGLIGGSELLVEGSVAVARAFGVSEAIIGLTIIAFGTSLPELAASAVAAFRKHSDMALGNIVGSNIFNIVGIVGVIALISPVHVPVRVVNFDMIMLALATLCLMPFMLGNKATISRGVAGFYLVAYLSYILAVVAGIEIFNLGNIRNTFYPT